MALKSSQSRLKTISCRVWVSNVQDLLVDETHTAAYATATFENVAGVLHHDALAEIKTKKHPAKPMYAGNGWAHAKQCEGIVAF